MATTYAALNPADSAANLVYSESDLRVHLPAGTQSGWRGVRGTLSKDSGKAYFTVDINSINGSAPSGVGNVMIGVANSAYNLSSISSSSGIRAFFNNASPSLTLRGGSNHGSTLGSINYDDGDVVGVALDFDAGTMEVLVNGSSLGIAHADVTGDDWYPIVFLLANSGSGGLTDATLNFGPTITPPATYPAGWFEEVLIAASRQWSAPYSLRIRAQNQWSALYDISPPVRAQWHLPYSLKALTQRQWHAPFSLLQEARQQWSLPYALLAPVTRQWSLPYSVTKISRQWFLPITSTITRQWSAPYSARQRITRQWSAPYSATNPVQAQWSARYDLLDHDPVSRQWRAIYDLAEHATIISKPVVTVRHGLVPVTAIETVIGITATGWGWTASIAVSVEDWTRMSDGDELTVSIDADTWSFIIDAFEQRASSPARNQYVIRCVSPVARYASPRADTITQDWTVASSAQAIVESLLEQAVDWQILDWQIAPGRLSVTDAAPLDVARQVVAAAGAILQSNPDGSLVVRYRVPIRVPDWSAPYRDHTYTDQADHIERNDTQQPAEHYDEVEVRDRAESSGLLLLEVDTRENGLNSGRSSFAPGDTVHLLVHRQMGVSITDALVSTGVLRPGNLQRWQEEQDLVFNETASASLRYPADSIDSITWLGTDLGSLSLDTDQMTVTVPTAGVAIARVKYSTSALSYNFTAPTTLAGLTEYPVHFNIEGDHTGQSGQIHIVARRGDGVRPATDIVDPLIGSVPVAIERGRVFLDLNSDLAKSTMKTVWRAGVRTGQLAEFHGAGRSHYGLIDSIQHRCQSPRVITTLGVLRHAV